VLDQRHHHGVEKLGFLRIGLGEVALWEVVRIGTWTTLTAGTVIIREGDEGDSFWLLVKGEVAVTLEAQSSRRSGPAAASERWSTSPGASRGAPPPWRRAPRLR
jgi:hypothetical protein